MKNEETPPIFKIEIKGAKFLFLEGNNISDTQKYLSYLLLNIPLKYT